MSKGKLTGGVVMSLDELAREVSRTVQVFEQFDKELSLAKMKWNKAKNEYRKARNALDAELKKITQKRISNK